MKRGGPSCSSYPGETGWGVASLALEEGGFHKVRPYVGSLFLFLFLGGGPMSILFFSYSTFNIFSLQEVDSPRTECFFCFFLRFF